MFSYVAEINTSLWSVELSLTSKVKINNNNENLARAVHNMRTFRALLQHGSLVINNVTWFGFVQRSKV